MTPLHRLMADNGFNIKCSSKQLCQELGENTGVVLLMSALIEDRDLHQAGATIAKICFVG